MRTAILLTVAALFGMGALGLIEHGTRQEDWLVGGAFLLIGVPLLGVARRQLGSAFAVTPQAKGLVVTGLYSRIPHPMYVFVDTALLGAIILLRQGWLLAVWAALVTLQAWQAGRETRVLEQAYGNVYREYRKRTWW